MARSPRERVKPLEDGTYAVLSRSSEITGKWYRVDSVNGVCPCEGYFYRQNCNHRDLLISLGLWGVDSRSPRVRTVLGKAEAGV